MEELLNTFVNKALTDLAERFVFRKLGLCYDYKTQPEEFPLKTLPTGKEINTGKGGPNGKWTGMHDCALNAALLFDGYAARLEIGFADPAEDRVYDRLIGGAIRLSTIAPKNAIIRGLGPDGKSFYSSSGADAYIYWAFNAWRASTTPSVSPESQAKLKNISSRWIENLAANNFVIPNKDEALNNGKWPESYYKPALLAVAYQLTGNKKWNDLALKAADFSSTPEADANVDQLLSAQLALHMFTSIFPEEEASAKAREKLTAIARIAGEKIKLYKNFNKSLTENQPDLDWRQITANDEMPASWARVVNEKDSISTAVAAALCMLMAENEELSKKYAEELTDMFRSTPWEDLILARSLSPLASIHARGVEQELWDKPLNEYSFAFNGEEALAARFMENDYDENNPAKAGHTEAPPKKEEKGTKSKKGNNGKKRRRRRRRKSKTS